MSSSFCASVPSLFRSNSLSARGLISAFELLPLGEVGEKLTLEKSGDGPNEGPPGVAVDGDSFVIEPGMMRPTAGRGRVGAIFASHANSLEVTAGATSRSSGPKFPRKAALPPPIGHEHSILNNRSASPLLLTRRLVVIRRRKSAWWNLLGPTIPHSLVAALMVSYLAVMLPLSLPRSSASSHASSFNVMVPALSTSRSAQSRFLLPR
mmetsp:Transcript_9766/g.17857  ORF Transcript_9766/g.17857 Transcript_9766/m.17857 type:complete len:208 (+) Transcript_9766:1910-2533(+)